MSLEVIQKCYKSVNPLKTIYKVPNASSNCLELVQDSKPSQTNLKLPDELYLVLKLDASKSRLKLMDV